MWRLPVSFLLLVTTGWGQEFRGRVVRILDGDTVEVLRATRPVRIRLSEVDCPERGQPFGTRARQFTGSKTFEREVTVKLRDVDRYGRTVAEIRLPDGRSLNRELVRAGLAWHYLRYSSSVELAALEADARRARRGLWADPHPVPPWEFRRNEKPVPSPALSRRMRQRWTVNEALPSLIELNSE
jgi:endonuclease YncB( thermonuclease family)